MSRRYTSEIIFLRILLIVHFWIVERTVCAPRVEYNIPECGNKKITKMV